MITEKIEPYYRFGDLLPDNYPSLEPMDDKTRGEMLAKRDKWLEGSKDLRSLLQTTPDGEWMIDTNLRGAIRCEMYSTAFRNYLSELGLLFSAKGMCEMVIEEMKKTMKKN